MLKITLIITVLALIPACATKDLTPLEKQEKKAELIEHCRELKREMDELKGQPIRRNAATQMFNSECRLTNEGGYFMN